MPRASIVLTTHNRPESAQRALVSALGQTIAHLEVIVVDDGSDEPFRLESADPRVRLIRLDPARGVCAARNAGLAAARGGWVTFLDDDDLLLPNMLELSLDAAAASRLPAPVAVLSGLEVVDEDGRVLETRIPPRLPRGSHYFLEGGAGRGYLTHVTLVAPTEALRRVGGWDEQLRAAVHDELFLRLNCVCSFEAVQAVTYRATDHAAPRRSRDFLGRAEGLARTYAKHRETFSLHRDGAARFLAVISQDYLLAGRTVRALGAATRSLFYNPRRPGAVREVLRCVAGRRAWTMYRRIKTRIRTEGARSLGSSHGGTVSRS